MIQVSEFDLLFFLPMGLAVAFLLWVFWNLARQIHR